MRSLSRLPMRRLAIGLVFALVLGACDWRGPSPTEQSLTSPTGPFTVGTVAVPSSAGFGGGTIYYPSNNAGPFAVISISPGFLGNQTSIAGWGPRLASNGFVVITINTTNGLILPDQRSTEQRQALTYAINQSATPSSPIAGRVDPNRKGVAGHSMGGGASLISANADPSIRAAMPLAPWNSSASFPNLRVPTLVWACQSDNIAAVASHASPMYNSIPATTDKMYVSVAGGDHFCANDPSASNQTVGKYGVAFFKEFLDADGRYDPWVCGASRPTVGSVLNEVRSTCPFL
jgi:predicted dienelactone hydrolase